MTEYVFIAQQTIAAWLDQEKITFVDNIMTIKSDRRQFRLQEAVRFLNLEEGEDAARLVGKVKTVDKLALLKAERCHDSVIFQDAAYKVQEGFVGEVMLNTQSISEKESHDGPSDEELLKKFLLKNL
jgi:hypothetical protein